MPGAGGGSHGGGFGGGSHGGGFGGGFGGGGFRGGYRGGYRGYRGFGFGPRYYGGGCLGGLLGIFMGPIICIVVAVIIFFSFIGTSFESIKSGGLIIYDEEKFQDYADLQYSREFNRSVAYEDNILLVITTNDTYDGYYVMAWVGDHINYRINNMFGDEYTELGRDLEASINTRNYKYSLDSNLAMAVELLTDDITRLNLTSSFKCTEDHIQVQSCVRNYSDVEMTEETVNEALEAFTDATGIPFVIVVDTEENVFGRTSPVIFIIFIVGLLIIAALLIFRGIMGYRFAKNSQNNQNFTNNDNNTFDM